MTKAPVMRTCDTAGAHRYSPAAIDIHYVLDMSLRTRYVLRTRKIQANIISKPIARAVISNSSAARIYRDEYNEAYRHEKAPRLSNFLMRIWAIGVLFVLLVDGSNIIICEFTVIAKVKTAVLVKG